MIQISHVTKKFGSETVLRDVSLQAEPNSILTLLGPSGSGKSTLLRCVAGLETPDGGEIVLGDTTVFSAARRIELPPNKRRLGMVFQSYAIWPHLSVAGNVAYPLESQHRPRAEIEQRVSRALRQVGLEALAKRDAPNLSGGQQQRVALARAIVAEPDLLLLDEPLSNLDARLRAQMRAELGSLQKSLGLSMLYVTHDQEEALALAHRIALMRDGVVVEFGAPAELYERPLHRFTAEFLGLANFLTGELVGHHNDAAVIDTAFGRFTGRVGLGEQRLGESGATELFFRPHHATIDPDGPHIGVVSECVFLGEMCDVTLRQGEHSLRLRLHPSFAPEPGSTLRFRVSADQTIIFLPPRSGAAAAETR